MARPLRVEYSGALYHIVSHGNGKLWLFKDDKAFFVFLDVLGNYIKKYKVTIHNFVFMRNHFHLIMETHLPNLSIFMSQVLRDFAIYYNKVNQRRGSVFKSRYGAFLVQKDRYYKQLTKYVFYNPVKAKIVDNPYEYQWSSLYYIMRKDRSIKWFNPEVSLSLIGSREDLIHLIDSEDIPIGVEVVYNQFIGDKEWAESLIDENRLNEEISGSSLMERGYVSKEEIIQIITDKCNITNDELLWGKDKVATTITMYLMNIHTPMKHKEIGELFSIKKFTVAQRLWRFKKRDLTKPHIQRLLKLLEKQLLTNFGRKSRPGT